MSVFRLDAALRARLARNLTQFSRLSSDVTGLRPAAVALALVPGRGGEVAFLLTRRVADLSHHGGQFALPGGRLDAGETVAEAARRELEEELGVRIAADQVLGLLDDFVTRSGFVITPVVLWGPDVLELAPSPREVAIAYRVPVRDLYRPEVPVVRAVEGLNGPLLSLPLLGTHIFSPTAAIVFQMREVAFEGRDTRVHHYDQPKFAWK